jgi:16S rRNA (guanine527-N7)-methyltransferase
MLAPQWFAELLENELRPWLTLSKDQIEHLWQHYEILLRWNAKMNLTSIAPGEEMVVRHYCESLFFGAHLPGRENECSVVDLGSGAGFPGVPLAISHPTWRLTLLESNQKKAVFLRESTRKIPNISVLSTRAEAVTQRFDWIISRGVDAKTVLQHVPARAPRLGLMLGENDFSRIQTLSGIAWLEPVRLPWGDRRLCVYGVSRETVPRGT